MIPTIVGILVFLLVFGSAYIATRLRRRLPEHHLSADTKDTVKLAMGLVATMTALVLGLLVAAAKGSYDTQKNEVIASAAKLIVIDLGMKHYGPEAAEARVFLREAVQDMVEKLWPGHHFAPVVMDPNTDAGSKVYNAIENLVPQTDAQRELKGELRKSTLEVGQMRWLLFAESGSAIAFPLLLVVVCWLAILFFSFGLFAPPNHTALISLFVSALSVSGAIYLILELDQPFKGLIHIPSRPLDMVLVRMGK